MRKIKKMFAYPLVTNTSQNVVSCQQCVKKFWCSLNHINNRVGWKIFLLHGRIKQKGIVFLVQRFQTALQVLGFLCVIIVFHWELSFVYLAPFFPIGLIFHEYIFCALPWHLFPWKQAIISKATVCQEK